MPPIQTSKYLRKFKNLLPKESSLNTSDIIRPLIVVPLTCSLKSNPEIEWNLEMKKGGMNEKERIQT